MKIGLIYARGTNGAFGHNNQLPWSRNQEDMEHFAKVTKGHAVLMGRHTWASLPEAYRPLPGRLNMVLSSRSSPPQQYTMRSSSIDLPNPMNVNTFEQAMLAAKLDRRAELWIIGGAQLLQSMQHHASVALVTEIDTVCQSDIQAPILDAEWELVSTRPASFEGVGQFRTTYRFHEYRRH